MVYVILKDDSGCCGCHISYDIVYISEDYKKIQYVLNELHIEEKVKNYRDDYSDYYVKKLNVDTLISREECHQF